MFLDASAIIAILGNEEDAGYLLAKIETADEMPAFSALSAFEAVVGLARKKASASRRGQASTPVHLIAQAEEIVYGFLAEIGAREVTIGAEVGRRAIEACKRYGRAVGHPAQLNFGDCFAYACARSHHLPLLFKGNDFSRTDVDAA